MSLKEIISVRAHALNDDNDFEEFEEFLNISDKQNIVERRLLVTVRQLRVEVHISSSKYIHNSYNVLDILHKSLFIFKSVRLILMKSYKQLIFQLFLMIS